METLLPELASHVMQSSLRDVHQKSEHIVGMYVQAQGQHKRALLTLLKARTRLHEVFVWRRNAEAEWESQEITLSNQELIQSLNEVNSAFTDYVRSWQPVMDALAALVQLALEVSSNLRFERAISMTELSKRARRANWPAKLGKLRSALVEGADWYISRVRIMRNQFVHNERVAFITPIPESQYTNVQIKKLGRDETLENFDLDRFITWICGKHLLFCADLVEGIEELY